MVKNSEVIHKELLIMLTSLPQCFEIELHLYNNIHRWSLAMHEEMYSHSRRVVNSRWSLF